jgi:CO/xanthine dehydrogenase Mo-binding subunit
MFEPLISLAARKLGIDEVEIRKINAPVTGSQFGPADPKGKRSFLTSAFAREALDKGATEFNWEERKKRSGRRNGSKVTGVGVALANFTGTLSVHDTARVAAEVLGMRWDKCEIIWGDTSKHLPWSSRQGGSQTIHGTSRANYAAAMDARQKLQEIAAKDLGGKPEDYDVGDERVFRKGSTATGLSFAQAARRAIELGGKFDGHEVSKDLNPMTAESAAALAGTGLMGVAKDNYGRKGNTQSYVAAFAELEVDVETGEYKILDYLCVADVGTVVNPRGLEGQLHGGAIQGIGYMRSQKWVYDQNYGVPLAKRFHYNKPPTILDIPEKMAYDAVNIPDPQTPIGAKGIAEAAVGAGAAAVRCALAAAIGDEYVRRTPVGIDMILSSLDSGKRTDRGLTANV